MNTARQPIVPPGSARSAKLHGVSLVSLHPNRSPMPSSEELNRWAQSVASDGDRAAFAALYKHFAPRVKAYLVRIGTADGLAEELTQEAMVSVWRKASQFDASRASASTWVFTIARNLRVDHFRRLGNRAPQSDIHEGNEADELCDPQPLPEDRLDARRQEDDLRDAMRQLSPDQALVLKMSFFDDTPHARIATELGIPLGTVKSRLRLAVGHLRRIVGAPGKNEP
jgi:RNA polymerase sigma factor (sigma-70 family)